MTPLMPPGQALLAVLVAPRRCTSVPSLLVTSYIPLSQGVMLGSYNFFANRLMI